VVDTSLFLILGERGSSFSVDLTEDTRSFVASDSSDSLFSMCLLMHSVVSVTRSFKSFLSSFN